MDLHKSEPVDRPQTHTPCTHALGREKQEEIDGVMALLYVDIVKFDGKHVYFRNLSELLENLAAL